MNWRDRLRFGLYRNRRQLGKSYQRGWRGLSIVVLGEDSTQRPASLRLNYFILAFLICLIGLPPLAAGSLLLNREGDDLKRRPAYEKHQALLGMSGSLLSEKEQLLSQATFQIESLEAAANGENWSFFRDLVSFRSAPVVRARIEPGLDRFSYDLKLISRLRRQARQTLQKKAKSSLGFLWNRALIHHAMPRGWALQGQVGRISSPYGNRRNPIGEGVEFHSGIDFAYLTGTPIIATAPGVVIRAEDRAGNGYGKFVRIHHGLGYTALYAHCRSLAVSEGQFVERGEVIAWLGQTGRTTGPHLHYEVQLGDDAPSNPMPYVDL